MRLSEFSDRTFGSIDGFERITALRGMENSGLVRSSEQFLLTDLAMAVRLCRQKCLRELCDG